VTVEQAIKKLQAEADYHRSEGRWTAAHDWQRYANELAHLAAMAKALPRRPAPKRS
jgi:hypothetical protein